MVEALVPTCDHAFAGCRLKAQQESDLPGVGFAKLERFVFLPSHDNVAESQSVGIPAPALRDMGLSFVAGGDGIKYYCHFAAPRGH